MSPAFLQQLSSRLSQWLNATPIQKRLHYLTLLNVTGLVLLLSLGLLSSVIKDSYFQSLEQLSTQQRQIQHFNAETARLQVSIQNYMESSDPALKQQIDRITTGLFQELSTSEQHQNDYSADLHTLHESLKTFIDGYQELKAVNQNIDRLYRTELLVPSQRSAELLSIATDKLGRSKKHLVSMSSAVAVDAFIEALLNINTYYASRENTISQNTQASLGRITQLIPLLRSMSDNRVEQEAFDALQQQIDTMTSGLDKLQSNYARRNSILETKIEGSQHTIAHTADILDHRYVTTEEKLRASYSSRLAVLNSLAVAISIFVIILTFVFSELVFTSIRTPLIDLLKAVKAFSDGHFDHPVPKDGQHELGLLAAGLRDFRSSALQRMAAEQALRDSEERFRALSDMSSDFFWEQNETFEFTVLSGRKAAQLQSCNALNIGMKAWESPLNTGYEGAWEQLQRQLHAQQAFRNFEYALRMPDASLLYLLVNGDPIFAADGQFRGYRGTAKDISAQKATEAEIRLLNQSLEQRVIERTRELRESNEQLSQAMEQLVQSEKLASLGNLVAGVAHELNTPLGNALIATTSLRDQVCELDRHVSENSLRKSDLLDFIASARQGCLLVENNAQRAVSLITNFKQVAVDQTSAQRRNFDLRQTVQEVISTLNPSLRKHSFEVTIDIPADLVLDSYPGPLDQVITNIITNATIHAYEVGQSGSLLIHATPLGNDQVELLIADTGQGIPTDRLGKVFDPFFTTRLGQGGSGLGLYIVYNIVTSLLGGSIQLLSIPDAGTCFVIRLPLEAPHADIADPDVHDSTRRQ